MAFNFCVEDYEGVDGLLAASTIDARAPRAPITTLEARALFKTSMVRGGPARRAASCRLFNKLDLAMNGCAREITHAGLGLEDDALCLRGPVDAGTGPSSGPELPTCARLSHGAFCPRYHSRAEHVDCGA